MRKYHVVFFIQDFSKARKHDTLSLQTNSKGVMELHDNDHIDIFQAIEKDSPIDVRQLVKLKQIDIEEDGGWNPLHAAARKGNIEIVKLIVGATEQGRETFYDINATFECINNYSDERGTALSEALLNGHKDVAKFLVEQGADVNAEFYSQNYSLLEWQFGFYDECTNEGICWWLADNELLNFMMPYGVDLEAKVNSSTYKEDALILAIKNGKKATVELLLELGVSVNRKIEIEDFGFITYLYSAVIYAMRSNNKKDDRYAIIQKLIQYEAFLEPLDGDTKESPLAFVLEQNTDDKLDEILGLKSIRDRLNFTEKGGNIDVVELTEEFKQQKANLLSDKFQSLRFIRDRGQGFLESSFLAAGSSDPLMGITTINRRVPFHPQTYFEEQEPFTRDLVQKIKQEFLAANAYDSYWLGALGFLPAMENDLAISAYSFIEPKRQTRRLPPIVGAKWESDRIAIDITNGVEKLRENGAPIRDDLLQSCLVSNGAQFWLELRVEYAGENNPLCAVLIVEYIEQCFLFDLSENDFPIDVGTMEKVSESLIATLVDYPSLCHELELAM